MTPSVAPRFGAARRPGGRPFLVSGVLVSLLAWSFAATAYGQGGRGVSPLDRFQRAVSGVQLAPDDTSGDLFRKVQSYALEVASRARGNALAELRALELCPGDQSREMAALGPLAGLYMSDLWMKAANRLRGMVATGECWEPERASAIAEAVSAATWRAVERFDALAARDANIPPLTSVERASLAQGVPALARAIANGTEPSALEVPDATALTAFEAQIVDQFQRRMVVLEAKARKLGMSEVPRQFQEVLGAMGWREEPSVIHAYLLRLADDRGCRERAGFRFEGLNPLREEINRDIVQGMHRDWMEITNIVREAQKPARDQAIRLNMKQVQDLRVAEQRNQRCLEAVLSLAAAAGRCTETLGPVHAPEAVDCALVADAGEAPAGQAVALVPLMVERNAEAWRVSVGIPLLAIGSSDILLDIAGTTMVVPANPAAPAQVVGLPIPADRMDASIPRDWRESLLRVAEPGWRGGSRSLGGLRTDWAFGGTMGIAQMRPRLMAAAWRSGEGPDLRLRQITLATLARRWMNGGEEREHVPAAAGLFEGDRDGDALCRLLCAELRERVGTAKPGDPPVFEILDLPADALLRTATRAANGADSPPFLALAPETAVEVARWVRERDGSGDQRQWDALKKAVAGGLLKAGLAQEDVDRCVGRSCRSIEDTRMALPVVAERWARASVPLVRQAAMLTALQGAARAQALDGLEWMLIGAAAPQPLNLTKRKGAWIKGLQPFGEGIRSRACDGIEDATLRDAIASDVDGAFHALFWWIASPGFPALNFDPDAAWLARCVERALTDADAAGPAGGGAPTVSRTVDADLPARRDQAYAAVARLASVLLVEPDPPVAPNGHGAASMPAWARSYACSYSPLTGMLVTIERQAD